MYYQLGGFQKHLDALPEGLAQPSKHRTDDGIELVLGIRPNGASYLLVPKVRYERLGLRLPAKAGWPSTRFLSLSPIHFPNKAALRQKLQTLVSNKKAQSGGPRDRSKANTAFTVSGDAPSDDGKARASFEHQRVLCRLYRDELQNKAEFSLWPVPWVKDIRMVTFTYNTWIADDRPQSERERNPMPLDVGWSEFPLPSSQQIFLALSSTHLAVKETRLFNNPGIKRLDLESGASETVEKSRIHVRLQQFLSTRGRSGSEHVLLLVHDARKTSKVLNALGIDTSRFTYGTFDLLYGGVPNSQPRNGRGSQSNYQGQSSRDPRSRSPRRNGGERQVSRPRSPSSSSSSTSVGSVHVVDVRELYHVVRRISPLTDTVRQNALALGVRDVLSINPDGTRNFVETDENGLCAGSESRLLGYMWESMARGPALDEQRVLRWSSTPVDAGTDEPAETPASDPAGEPDEENVEDQDEEMDPNDILQPTASTSNVASRGSGTAQNKSLSIMDAEGWDLESDDDW